MQPTIDTCLTCVNLRDITCHRKHLSARVKPILSTAANLYIVQCEVSSLRARRLELAAGALVTSVGLLIARVARHNVTLTLVEIKAHARARALDILFSLHCHHRSRF